MSDVLRAANDRTVALPRIRWRTAVPLVILLALAVHAVLPQLTSMRASLEVVRTMQWWGVGLAVVAQTASYWGSGVTVHRVAQLTGDRLSLGQSTAMVLAASSIGTVAGGPVGYAGATLRWALGLGVSTEGAVLCGWLPALMNTVVLVVFAVVGMVILAVRRVVPVAALIPVVMLAIVVFGAISFIGVAMQREDQRRQLLRRISLRWAKLRRRPLSDDALNERIEHFELTWHRLGGGRWRAPLLGAVANTGFDLMTVAFLFVAARTLVSPGALLAGYGLPQLFARIGVIPGGLGIVEGGMVGAYVGVGVSHTDAVLVVLAYRLLSFWLPSLIGFVLAARLERTLRTGSQ